MDKHAVVQRLLQAVSLSCLATWWVFFVVWQPGFVSVIEQLSYRFEPSALSAETITNATTRAMEYATKGASNQADIFFTQPEVSHLNDVSKIFKTTRIILGFAAITSCGVLLLSLCRDRFHIDSFKLARNILLGEILFLGASLVIFPIFFILFHKIVFPQGNWAFPEQSTLIQLFPETFWKFSLGWLFLGTSFFAFFYHVVGCARRHHAR